MKNKRYILIVLFILTIAGSILGLRFYQELETYRKQVSEIEIFILIYLRFRMESIPAVMK